MKEQNYMLKFLKDRKHLPSIIKSIKNNIQDERPHLVINNPIVLSSFMGYLKFQIKKECNYEVLFRGQTKDFLEILPTLFRGNNNRFKILEDALTELKKEVKNKFKPNRFQNENIENLFQHYGINSRGIDVVDNIFVAVWFALMKSKCIDEKQNIYDYERNDDKFGWIYFFKVPRNLIYNLSQEHSSLSLRMHCQHGYMIHNNDILQHYSFDKFLIATVKIPNNDSFLPLRKLFETSYLFPNKNFDNTYKLLSGKKFKKILNEVEIKYELSTKELGSIINYK